MLRNKSKERSSPRKVTPPSPSYMSSEQFATYLAGLRDNRVNRPGGARPPPPSMKLRRESIGRLSLGATTSVLSEASTNHQKAQSDEIPKPKPRGSRPSMAGSVLSRYSTTASAGKDYHPENSSYIAPLKPGEVVPSATYIERGQRWMERKEAISLREAIDVMDAMDSLDLGAEKKHKERDKDKAKDKKSKDEGVEQHEEEDDESRLYDAALNEAAELVWQHQHGVKVPEAGTPYRYKSHMRQNSYARARAASAGRRNEDVGNSGLSKESVPSLSGSVSNSERGSSQGSPRTSLEQQHTHSVGSNKTKSYGALSGTTRADPSTGRRSSMKRNISGEIEKPFSGDQIWEEPEGSTVKRTARPSRAAVSRRPIGLKARGVPNRVQFASASSDSDDDTEAQTAAKPVSRYEIHKNPPSQSRNPAYTTNNPAGAPRTSQEVPTKNGMEIRSDDIRQATSMRLKDRSVKLPTPSAVSDNPGRPIVSFDRNWQPPEEATDSKPEESSGGGSNSRVPVVGVVKERAGSQQIPPRQQPPPAIAVTPDAPVPVASSGRALPSTPSIPSIQVNDKGSGSGPQVPTISISSDRPVIPSIVLPGDDNDNSTKPPTSSIPAIITPDDNNDGRRPSARPLPDPKAVQRSYDPLRDPPRSHWSPAPSGVGPAGRRATATCHECGLAIEGRFVGLAGTSERFHPQCFRCYACGTALEAMEISPEPDTSRAERLERIRRRAAGEVLEEVPGKTMAEDGDTRLRFFCHLDWHEQFAPRCRHCKTPILGEHVVALGAHWHYGHFFCAECGDPFERGDTHIEKDGYAWCVGCQTKRTERRAPKCRGCRLAVVGQYVRALGGEWHDTCFRCSSCGGGFEDGQIFPMRERGEGVVLCTRCRAAELKM
ncbi:hypothetical protein GGS23DRAFT_605571 [Durotheca rogersii]|uniref:uncharacterized protein n=1 Tax=Durotheca rogersii TaxID=419775 RepID=UPI00221EF2A3|nr:uncharacterized protein GGS23DRAFT_605571 [Durotheca rogersii]KAI5862677.1 hypothetical protein GGS23DRAFT_605571 [Durotheca rogersii]